MKNKLSVAETFYSIQGEGTATGCPSVFLRLAGCNLLCGGADGKRGTWVCDTVEVWKHGVSKPFEEVLDEECIMKLHQGARLIVTGGEPLLQQKQLYDYILWLCTKYFLGSNYPVIEVETNGTINPSIMLFNLVDQWNVSFKLSNSGEPWRNRVSELALRSFNSYMQTVFKIVITREEDIQELIQDFIAPGVIDPRKLVLMPGGASREELDLVRPWLVERCKQLVMRYTDRLHIVIWNKKTGV